MLEGAVDSLQGQLIADGLDFMSKEVVRLAEEQRIATFVGAAREARRVREAEESGRRQAEHVVRKKKEHLLHEVMQVHRASADRFVDSLLGATADEVATARADGYKASLAQKTTASAAQPPPSLAEEAKAVVAAAAEEPSADSVVRYLLSSFVLPEVARQRLQAQQHVRDRKFMVSAHAAVAVAFDEALSAQAGSGRLTHPVPLAGAAGATPRDAASAPRIPPS